MVNQSNPDRVVKVTTLRSGFRGIVEFFAQVFF